MLSDLEITKRCALAMGIENNRVTVSSQYVDVTGGEEFNNHITFDAPYDPLNNDAQAMALVKKFRILVHPIDSPLVDEDLWYAGADWGNAESVDLNRAICECVAKRGD